MNRAEALALGARRRALIEDLVGRGYGDLAIMSILVDEHADLLPEGKTAALRIKRELRAVRKALGDPEDAGERSLLASLRRQLALVEVALAKAEPSEARSLAQQAQKLAERIGVLTGSMIVNPGFVPHLGSRPRPRKGTGRQHREAVSSLNLPPARAARSAPERPQPAQDDEYNWGDLDDYCYDMKASAEAMRRYEVDPNG